MLVSLHTINKTKIVQVNVRTQWHFWLEDRTWQAGDLIWNFMDGKVMFQLLIFPIPLMHLLDGGQRVGLWFVGEGIGMWINQSLVVGSSHIAKTGKISGIDPCEKRINILRWACLAQFFYGL